MSAETVEVLGSKKPCTLRIMRGDMHLGAGKSMLCSALSYRCNDLIVHLREYSRTDEIRCAQEKKRSCPLITRGQIVLLFSSTLQPQSINFSPKSTIRYHCYTNKVSADMRLRRFSRFAQGTYSGDWNVLAAVRVPTCPWETVQWAKPIA